MKQARGKPQLAPAVRWVPKQATPYLGVDIGGVLIDRAEEGGDTSFFGSRPMETPIVDGALEALARLVEAFEGRVCIVSKAGPRIQELSRRWLVNQGIAPALISWDKVHFVSKRADKGPVCEQLGITSFIDDNVGVLNYLTTVRRLILFSGGTPPDRYPKQVPKSMTLARSWPEATRIILDDLRAGH